ncbi:MAG: hypothetical protein IKQ37_11685 [Bacteroidaceae bacterium]|nr:hypothetical protein [Bacteroidaceae bacterium]
MWEHLATSPYRLDTADVRALKVELESISFFRDNEFSGRLADGYSLPGLWVQPKLTYMPLRQIKLELGLQALIFNGANRYPNYVYHDIALWKGNQYTSGAHLLPWFRAQADFRRLSIVLGNIYGGQNHGLIEPLFNPETNLTQDPEMGFQLLWDRPHLHADIWLNWQSYIFREDTHQEAFTVGTTWRIMPGKSNVQCSMFNVQRSKVNVYLPIQLVAQHRGGEQNVWNRNVQTIWNASAGVGLRWNVGKRVLKSLTMELDGMFSYQQTGHLWPFKSGVAGYASVRLGLWQFLDTGLSFFATPRHFVSLYGNHFYSTLSVKDGVDYGKLQTAALHVRFHHTFARGYTLGADAEAFQTWQSHKSDLSFSFGIYLRVNPSFLIKRF